MTSSVTRFAPSPTGYLHIGGARTALFNWLFSQHNNGKFRLRIEDTDRERSTDDAINKIIEGLEWLGIQWNDEIVFQYSRAGRHQEVAKSMVANGTAYYCYTSPQELEEMREKAKAEGRPQKYDGRWRDRDPSEAPVGVKPVIRLKAPLTGETVVDDVVQGRVTWQNKDLDDFVLLRSDETPTFMLAVVVDDHDMGITHIIRGDDHLTNAARQTQIYQAMGWDVPTMAHIPLIHGADGAKLSKRHGALGVDEYRKMGYLPAALRNYLVRLGWSHGDQEIFSTEEMIKAFDLKHVGRSASRFDFVKLENLNGHYIRQTDDKELVDAIQNLLPDLGAERGLGKSFDEATYKRLLQAMSGLKERAKTLVELLDNAYYLYAQRPLTCDDKARSLLEKGRQTISGLTEKLANLSDWQQDAIEAVVRQHAENAGVKLGQVAQPMRAALTGRSSSPGLFDVMVVIGKEETLARLNDALSYS